jgi:hypothetical protein
MCLPVYFATCSPQDNLAAKDHKRVQLGRDARLHIYSDDPVIQPTTLYAVEDAPISCQPVLTPLLIA